MKLRTLAQLGSSLVSRARFANIGGFTFGGKRDLYASLGYSRQLFPQDYRSRYQRNGVAARIVEVKPQDTFRGGGELIESKDPEQVTAFEQAWYDLNQRLKIWPTFQKADILCGLGQYAIIVIVAPGSPDTPLAFASPDDIKFLTAYAQDDAPVVEFDNDDQSLRFGLPTFYNIRRTDARTPGAVNTNVIGKKLHWTRVIHVAETLDDRTYGVPRLERVWNLLDDLEKVTGGGAEAFWKRADAGMQIALDPTMTLEPDEIKKMQDETDDYIHGLKRVIRTRGVDMKQLGSDVANLGPSAESIIAQISAATGIPQRILMGSEQAKLASVQDRTNWDERIESRRVEFAEPYIVRPFIERMVELGAMPTPQEEYTVAWSQIKTMDDGEKADLANRWADINQKTGQDVVSPNEIRVQCLGLEPQENTPQLVERTGGPQGKMTGAASRKERSWQAIQRSADRFSRAHKASRAARIRRSSERIGEERLEESTKGAGSCGHTRSGG